MTKRQVSIRVDDAVLAAVDAAGGPRQRSATIEAWLAAQAAAQAANTLPAAQQAWYRAGALAAQATDCIDCADGCREIDNAVNYIIDALRLVVSAIDELAGTAPEEG